MPRTEPAATDRPRILVVDDHPLVRHGIATLIDGEPDLEVCGEAEDEDSAMEAVKRLVPDLVIVDLTLRSGDGLDLIKRIRAHDADLPVLVLTMHDLYVRRAFRAGAMGYLTKEEASDEILVAIRHLLRGGTYIGDKASSQLVSQRLNGDDEIDESVTERLTDRELHVFRLIGQGLGTREIARDLGLSPKTVETYRLKIRDKLGLESARELIQHAIRWVLSQGPP